MRKKTIRIGAVLVLFLLFPSYLSAGISTFEFKIIKLAFMNGYVRAVQSEDQTIRMLRHDRKFLEEFVTREAEKYMIEVKDLNKRLPDQKILKAGVETYRRNSNW